MKTIEVDDDLYLYIASQTKHIGENASEILRRLLLGDEKTSYAETVDVKESVPVVEKPASAGIVVGKEAGYEESVDGVKAMRSLLISDEFASSNKAIDRFLLILSSLYRIDHASFAEATQVKGRTRVYFSDDEQVLLKSGKTTKPRLIPDTPFWVITNNNTNRKRQMVEQLMTRMGFQAELIEKVSGTI